MGINDENDIGAGLQIGPTSEGMVRIYVEGEGFSLPLDFEPEEAEEIAEELRGAAERARASGKSAKPQSRAGKGGPAGAPGRAKGPGGPGGKPRGGPRR